MGFKFNTLLRAILAGSSSGPAVPSMYLNLSNPVNVTIADTQAAGTITSTAGGVINLSIEPSRISGIAPMYVNFDMTSTTKVGESNPIHNLDYRIDYGDTGAGNWINGVQSAGLISKNKGRGPVCGHVYETPGNYAVTAIAADSADSDNKVGIIEVLDPDVVFNPSYGAGYETICISSSGTFTGAPVGATLYTTPGASTDMYAAVLAKKGSNKRLLFCKGDNWTCSAQIVIANVSNMVIDGYGPGGDARTFGSGTLVRLTPADFGWPAVKGRSIFSTGANITDLKICNIKITAGSSHSAGGINESCTGVMFSKVEIRGAYAGWNSGASTGNSPYLYEQLCFYECLCDDLFGKPFIDYPTGESYAGGVGIYATLRHGGIMGCYLDSCNHGEQTVRIPDANCGHINNNYLARPNQSKNLLKINGVIHATFPVWTEKMVVSANFMSARNSYSYQAALGYTSPATSSSIVTQTIGPLIGAGNGGNGDVGGEWARHLIIENNYAEGCLGEPKGALTFADVAMPYVTVRNNIADFSFGDRVSSFTAAYIYMAIAMVRTGTGTADKSVGVRVYNNTLYSNLANFETAPMVSVWPSSAGLPPLGDVVAANNLRYLPFKTGTNRSTFYNHLGAATDLTDTTNTPDNTASPLFSVHPPVALADWKPSTGSYAINSGTAVSNMRDFNDASRVGGTYDLGAVLP